METEPRKTDGAKQTKKARGFIVHVGRSLAAWLCKAGKTQIILLALAALLLVVGPIAVLKIRSVSVLKSRTTNFGLKNIGELATQAGYFTNVQVISDSRELFGVTLPFTQSKYIYSYDGVIKAGVDFANIVVEPDEAAHTVTVTLPDIKILSIEVDQDSFQIYDESKSIFTPLELEKINQSFVKLKEEVQKTALANGLMESARANTETLVRGFLAGAFDLSIYTVVFK